MALKDNSPTLSYVSWRDLLITYNEETYPIQNSHTNMKYVYWDITNPYTLQCFNRTQNQYPGMYQLFINENGMGTERSHADLIITWDGNNSDLISSQIFGLHETNKEFGNKFVAIETDIDGLKQIVGEGGVDGNHDTIWEKISEIEQTSSAINLSVKELTQEFSDDKEVRELRENLNKSIIDYNSSLGIFKSEMSNYYKDKKIDSEEKVKINTHLDIIDSKASEVLKHISVVITMMSEGGQTTQVKKLESARTKFTNSVTNLRNYITTAISDNTIVPSEITYITDMFAKCNVAVNELKNVCDECIFLGAGGKITEELARIGIKSDEILISVSHNEESIKNNIGIEKSQFQGNMTDLKNAINQFVKVWNDISKDNSASSEEITLINKRLEEITLEKDDVDSKCAELNSDELLSEVEKVKLNAKHDEVNKKFTELKDKIEDIVKDGIISDSESSQLNVIINTLLISLNELHSIVVECIDDIQNNLTSAEIQEAKDSLKSEIDDVNNSIIDLDDYMNTIFKDNIISESERLVLEEKIKEMEKEKTDIDAKYKDLYNNPDLI